MPLPALLTSSTRAVGLVLAALGAFTAHVPGAEAAKTKNGIRLLAPKIGATVPVGTTTTFKARSRLRGPAYVHICTTKRRKWDGTLCYDADTATMTAVKRSHGSTLHAYRPPLLGFPTYYLNAPRVYYWQVFRIDCRRRGKRYDCTQESRVGTFRVG
jgi:hypothetical protein